MQLGRVIAIIREARGWTQKDLADKAGCVTASYLSLIERGKRTPSSVVLRDLAKTLVVPEYLIHSLSARPEDIKQMPPDQVDALARQLFRILIVETEGV